MDTHGPTPDTAELVAWIRSRTLPTTRVREGYWIEEVDGLLAAVCDDLLRGVPVGPERVAEARFTPVRMVTGYEQGATDAVLAELQERLRGPSGPSGADLAQDDLAAWVEGLRFTPTRLSEGYLMADVDQLLAGIRGDLEAGSRPGPDRVRGVVLRQSRLVPGYDLTEVDVALEELAVRLGGGSPAAGAVAPTAAAPTAAARTPRAGTGIEEQTSRPVLAWVPVVLLVLLLVVAAVLVL